MRLAVTTAAAPPPDLETRARQLADELRAPYFPRRRVTAARLFAETGASRLLLVERERLLLRDAPTGASYFFHPNLMLVRGLNLRQGMRDVFADATGLEKGGTILDCTVGFAAEATLAAFLVGETGKVVGLESVPELAVVTREGLQTFRLQTENLEAAMRRVEIVTADYRDTLTACASNTFDVVYFDPFFDERLPGSEHSVSPLHVFGNPSPLDVSAVLEARRVARRRVVIKHPKHEPLPPEIMSLTTAIVSGRKSKVEYAILEI